MYQLRQGGKLRLRRLNDDVADQRTFYEVDGQLLGISEPCLYPNIACRWPLLGKASGCPTNTLYDKEVFAKHEHVGKDGKQTDDKFAKELVPARGPRALAIRGAVEESKRTNTQSLVRFALGCS